MAKHAFSIDVEEWFHGIELPQSEWEGKASRIERGMATVLKLLDDAGQKATFFVLGVVAESHPEMVRALSEAGHEVASHGYCHEKLYRVDASTFRSQESKTKVLLEDLTGRAVQGHRAPYFSITRDSAWALPILSELGYRYDCSISPVVSWRYGIAGAPEGLYRFGDLDLIEYTVSSWSFLGRRLAAGGAYFRIFPFQWTTRPFAARQESLNPAMFYAHPWEYDPEHPRIRFGIRAMATHYANLKSTVPRTRRLIGTYPFGRVCDVIDDAQSADALPTMDSSVLTANG